MVRLCLNQLKLKTPNNNFPQHGKEADIMLSGWTFTFSFFGASLTLARQPETTWTPPQNAKLAAPAFTRSARRKRRQNWRRLLAAQNGSRFQFRQN